MTSPAPRSTALAALAAGLLAIAPALAAAPALATGPVSAPPATALASTTGGTTHTWGLVPAPGTDAAGAPAEPRVSFRFEVEPGGSVSDAVQVQNFSDEEITFRLTASDGVVTPDGVFDILPSDEEPVDLGSWVDVADEVTVPAQGTADVPFTIAVPADALPGDHPGGLTASILSTSQDAEGNAVSLDARVGVRVHMRVAGDLVPQVGLENATASYETNWNPFAPGKLTLRYDVANTGNVRVGAAQSAEVRGPLGIPVGADDGAVAEQREVLPRQSSAQEVTMRAWPLFHLGTDLVSAQNPVGEDVVEAEFSDARADLGAWAIPWPQLIVLALLTLVVVLWRRRSTSRKAKLEAALAEARAEGRAEAAGSTSAGTSAGTSADVSGSTATDVAEGDATR